MAQKQKIYIPTFISSIDYKPARVLPHIYFYNGVKQSDDYYIQNSSGSSVLQQTFPYFDNYSGNVPTTASLSLLFNNETAPYGEIPSQSLYSTYWSDYVNLLYNPRTRVFNAEAIIPLADYFKMELNDICEWRGNYYHIRAINNYNLSNGECEIELLGPIQNDVISNILPGLQCNFDFEIEQTFLAPVVTSGSVIIATQNSFNQNTAVWADLSNNANNGTFYGTIESSSVGLKMNGVDNYVGWPTNLNGISAHSDFTVQFYGILNTSASVNQNYDFFCNIDYSDGWDTIWAPKAYNPFCASCCGGATNIPGGKQNFYWRELAGGDSNLNTYYTQSAQNSLITITAKYNDSIYASSQSLAVWINDAYAGQICPDWNYGYNATGSFQFGWNPNSDATYLTGSVNSILFYNRVLNGTEILQNYTALSSGSAVGGSLKITLTEKGANAGLQYGVYYSSDCSTFTFLYNITFTQLDDFQYVSVPEGTKCIKLVEVNNPQCANEVIKPIPFNISGDFYVDFNYKDFNVIG